MERLTEYFVASTYTDEMKQHFRLARSATKATENSRVKQTLTDASKWIRHAFAASRKTSKA